MYVFHVFKKKKETGNVVPSLYRRGQCGTIDRVSTLLQQGGVGDKKRKNGGGDNNPHCRSRLGGLIRTLPTSPVRSPMWMLTAVTFLYIFLNPNTSHTPTTAPKMVAYECY